MHIKEFVERAEVELKRIPFDDASRPIFSGALYRMQDSVRNTPNKHVDGNSLVTAIRSAAAAERQTDPAVSQAILTRMYNATFAAVHPAAVPAHLLADVGVPIGRKL